MKSLGQDSTELSFLWLRLECVCSHLSLAHTFMPFIPPHLYHFSLYTLCVVLMLVLFLCVFTISPTEGWGKKSPGKPLSELDHRDPAVHSQGPLLLLAARRPTRWGSERGERVGGRRRSKGRGKVGGGPEGGSPISQLLFPAALLSCQR